MAAANFHATGIVLGTRGLLIAGPSGAGKTTLALALIDASHNHGRFARLIADDQVILSAASRRLIAHAPETIAGSVEVFGIGPRSGEHIGKAVIDGICRLVPATSAARLQDITHEAVNGIDLPKIELAERNVQAALLAVFAWMSGINTP